jgi:3'-phosphoadenosine 5'-phosphosulfate (PAPS) 3'-phosphatase
LERERELNAAVAAVTAASAMCDRTQGRLLAGDTLTKGDHSPVTVADFATQAVVAAALSDSLGPLTMVGEEAAAELQEPDNAALRDGVVELVRGERGADVTHDQVLGWIDLGGADGGSDRYWTLDPIDGTKGFLRGDQYAIALALIEDGEVVLGVLGCPNLPNADGSRGAVFAATGGTCSAWYGGATDAVAVRVSVPSSISEADSASRSSRVTPITATPRRSRSGSGSRRRPTASTASASTARSLAATHRSTCGSPHAPTIARRSGTTPPASSWSSKRVAASPTSPAGRSTSVTVARSPTTAA